LLRRAPNEAAPPRTHPERPRSVRTFAERQPRVSRAEAHPLLRAASIRRQRSGRSSHIASHFLDEIQASVIESRCRGQSSISSLSTKAHKLEGTARRRVITLLLHRRFPEVPVRYRHSVRALRQQFRRRLREFEHASTCTQSFRDEVISLPSASSRTGRHGGDYPRRRRSRCALRKYMVRDTGTTPKTRSTHTWRSSGQETRWSPRSSWSASSMRPRGSRADAHR